MSDVTVIATPGFLLPRNGEERCGAPAGSRLHLGMRETRSPEGDRGYPSQR